MRAKESVWDSKIFGVGVGILGEWYPGWTAADVREANRENFSVVFVKTVGWVDPPPEAVAVDHLYEMEAAVASKNESGVSLLKGEPSPSLLGIAQTAFADSRFSRDPHVGDRTAAFYRKWLEDARASTWVLADAADDAFFVAGQDRDGTGRIGLVAVNRGRRKRGLGTRLVHGVLARPGAPILWRVRVSARNWTAVSFYERLDFRVCGTYTAFHLWNDR